MMTSMADLIAISTAIVPVMTLPWSSYGWLLIISFLLPCLFSSTHLSIHRPSVHSFLCSSIHQSIHQSLLSSIQTSSMKACVLWGRSLDIPYSVSWVMGMFLPLDSFSKMTGVLLVWGKSGGETTSEELHFWILYLGRKLRLSLDVYR